MDPEQRLDYLYKEYVRLSQQAEDYIQSAFADLKLMGVIGATIALWKPVVDFIVLAKPEFDASGLLFVGFLSLLLIIRILESDQAIVHYLFCRQPPELRRRNQKRAERGGGIRGFWSQS